MNMVMPQHTILALLIVAGGSGLALVSGHSLVEARLPGGLPVGNVLAAIFLCSVAAASRGLSQSGSLLRFTASTSLAAAVAWLPVSIALAGNLELNFTGTRGDLWIGMTLVTLVAAFGSLVAGGVQYLVRRRRADKSRLV